MKYFIALFALVACLFLASLSGCHKEDDSGPESCKGAYILLRGKDGGMFHQLDYVMFLVRGFESGRYVGGEVDFQEAGLYYDPKHGPNWWNYYFQPLVLGDRQGRRKEISGNFACVADLPSYASREESHRLISKYFHLQPDVQRKIDDFVRKNFHGCYVIGVHYRGTDKKGEAPRVAFEAVQEQVDKVISTLGESEYRIFLATDEVQFVDFMAKLYQDKLVYIDAVRSADGTPVHLRPDRSQFLVGENAVMDAILLSKTNILIRSSSNLSRWSTYFNPDIPGILLNQLY